MGRTMYGANPSSFTVDTQLRVVPNYLVQVWDARAGGTQVLDLLTEDGDPITEPRSTSEGLLVFYGPDEENGPLWIDAGAGSRLAVIPTDPRIASGGNVPTQLALGTVTAESVAISSDGGPNQVLLQSATPTEAGVLSGSRAARLDVSAAWKGSHVGGATYAAHDMVADVGWLMISNQQTSDRPAPTPVGDPFDAYEGTGMAEQTYSAKQVIFGQRYMFGSGDSTLVNGWRLFTHAGQHYEVWRVEDPLGQDIPTQVLSVDAITTGWQDVAIMPTLVPAGATFDVLVRVTGGAPADAEWSARWDYQLPPSPAAPGVGQVNHSNTARELLQVHKTDVDGTDRAAALLALTAGDTVQYGGGPEWTVQAVNDQGTHVDVVVTPEVRGTAGVQTFTFETTAVETLTTDEDPGYWATSPYTVEGLFTDTGGFNDVVTNDTAYGVDLTVQAVSESPDWDVMSAPSSGSTGGGVEEAPGDGLQYGRESGTWTPIVGGGTGGAHVTVAPVGTDVDADYFTNGANDEVQINAAITAAVAATGRGTVTLSAGIYIIGASIILKTGVTLTGSGVLTELRSQSLSGRAVIEQADLNQHVLTVQDLWINCAGQDAHGIHLEATGSSFGGYPDTNPDADNTLKNIRVTNCGSSGTQPRHAFWLSGANGGPRASRIVDCRAIYPFGHGFFLDGASDIHLTNCVASTQGDSANNGFHVGGGSAILTSCKAFYCEGHGYRVTSSRAQLVNCNAQDNGEWGFHVTGADCVITGGAADSNSRTSTTGGGVWIGTNLVLTGMVISDRGQTPGSPQETCVGTAYAMSGSHVTARCKYPSGGAAVDTPGNLRNGACVVGIVDQTAGTQIMWP